MRTPEELYAAVQARAEAMANPKLHFSLLTLFWLLLRAVVGKPTPQRIPLGEDVTLEELRSLC